MLFRSGRVLLIGIMADMQVADVRKLIDGLRWDRRRHPYSGRREYPQRAQSLRHPYVVRISIGRIPMGPNALQFSERVLAILRAGGLPPRLAVQGYLLLIATVNGFTVDETGMEDGADPSGATEAQRLSTPGGRSGRRWGRTRSATFSACCCPCSTMPFLAWTARLPPTRSSAPFPRSTAASSLVMTKCWGASSATAATRWRTSPPPGLCRSAMSSRWG